MSTRRYLSALLFALSTTIGLPSTASASDYAKELRWASQLREQLLVGEALSLNDGQRDFFALFTLASGAEPRGAVILLHGLGAHPDWPEVIAPLREQLPEAGWATLSIQLPVRPNEAEFADYPPLFPAANTRISAAIRHLQQSGLQNIVIVGHSLGGAMGAYFLASQSAGSEQVRAFVGIGMSAAPGTLAHSPDNLAKVKIPVLDLYGAQDSDGVLKTAKSRAASQADNPQYRQLEVPGADHFFRGLDAPLVKRVASWLQRVAPAMTVEKEEK